jgi:gliding motility-associated-like protein
MKRLLHFISILILFFIANHTFAQGDPDCSGAFTLCSDASISFNPNGIGTDDFASPSNNAGCLSGDENNSAWYYLEFNPLTPPGSQLEFTISPTPAADYDFAVFGPNVTCGALGGPVRCSWAGNSSPTGLGNGATDFSEGAGGNGFVAPLNANPGDGYYILIDNWSGNGAAFDLSFGGSAAPYLDCSATPCSIILTYGTSYSVCGGDPPLTFTGSVDGASASATYLWTEPSGGTVYMNDPTSPNPTVSYPPGISNTFQYTLTLTDGACIETTTVDVTVNPLPTVAITGDAQICPGGNGTLNATPGYSSYAWSPSGSGPSINISNPGLYSVTVTGPGGCFNTASFNVSPAPSPNPMISGPTELCPGATAVLDAGAGYDTYQWQDNSTGQTLNISNPGTYSVTVTQSGCSGTATFTVTPGQSVAVLIDGELNFCANGFTVLDAGPGYSSYSWSGGGNNQTLIVNFPGTYTVTVTDANGCTGTNTVTVNQLPPFIPDIFGDLNVCTGSPASLNTDPIYSSYEWSTGETFPGISPSLPGTYFLTVTDAQGCTGETFVEVTQLPDPTPVISGDLTFCSGQSTVLSADPGFASYQWSTGSTNAMTTVSVPGAVSLDVTDGSGCMGSTIINVFEAPAPAPTISGPASVCIGGSINLSADPGFASYQWSNGDSGADIMVSLPGIYILTVTNSEGCTGTSFFEVVEAPPLQPQIDGELTFCQGSSTLLSVSGGNFIGYQWSTGSTDPTYEAFISGPVNVTVTDGNGCQGETSVNLTTSPTPMPSIAGNPNLCTGSSVMLEATPGFNTYSWTNGTPTAQNEVFLGGFYEVTVTDAIGCEGTASITINELSSPEPTISGNTNLCQGQQTQLTVNEVFPEYSWYDGSSDQAINISIGGPVSVTVTDANGCQGETSSFVEAIDAPTPAIAGPTNFCEGSSAQLDAGSGYHTYLWSNGSTDQLLEVFTSDQYAVTVTNDEGCEGVATLSVDEISNPEPIIIGETNICIGSMITLTAEAGYSTYEWQDGSTNPILDIIVGGSYTVSVTDANGCQGEATIQVDETPPLEPMISGITELCQGDSTVLSASSGFSTYEWDNGATTPTITTSIPGMYIVSVTDDNGCQGNTSVEIDMLPSPMPSIAGQSSICPGTNTTLSVNDDYSTYQWSDNSQSDSLVVETSGEYSLTVTNAEGCTGTDSFLVDVYAVDTLAPMEVFFCSGDTAILNAPPTYTSYVWDNGSTAPNIPTTTAGDYAYSVTDTNGCILESTISAIENNLPSAEISGETAFCSGDNVILSGPPSLQYAWSDGSTTENITVNTPGPISLIVTDDNGCSNTDTVEITENSLPDASISGLLSFCADGATTLSAPSGMANYNWSTNDNTPSISVSSAATYSITVTDDNGCQNSSSVNVDEVEELLPQITGELDFCTNSNTIIDAGDGYDAYLWSDGSTGQTLLVDSAGAYSVTVTDSNGCEGDNEVDVIVNDLPEVAIDGSNFLCVGDSSMLSASASFTAYEWQDGSTENTITANAAGLYLLTVTDANGCQNTASLVVDPIELPTPQINGALSFCPGTSTALSTGTAYSTYLWSTGDTEAGISVNTPDTYQLTVTDEFGCVGSTGVDVEYFTLVPPALQGDDQFCPGTNTLIEAENGYTDYIWSDNTLGATITIEQAGTYSVSATDANGCEVENSIIISNFDVVVPGISAPNDFCSGNSITINAESGFQSYEWSTNEATESISTSNGGFFEVTVTDQNGCLTSNSIQIIENPLPNVAIGGSASFCTSGFTTLNAGNTYDAYAWSNGDTTFSTQVNQAATYSLTVTDMNGCQNEGEIQVIEANELSPIISGPTAFCPGDTISIDGGEGFSSYLWSNGATSQSIQIEQTGSFSLMVTDEAGCMGSTSVDIVEYIPPTPVIDGPDGFCAGTSITLTASGGEFSTIDWGNGSAPASIEIEEPGNYILTVQDSNGCTGSTSRLIEAYVLPDFEIDGELAYCADASTVLSASSTFASYEWSTQETSAAINVNTPGNYALTVTNANGCSSQQVVMVTEFALPEPEIEGETGFCEGSQTILSANNPYPIYEWSGGFSTSTITINNPGTYSLSVTDNNGCTGIDSVMVNSWALPVPQIEGITGFCADTSTTLSVTGGDFESYIWSTGQDESSITTSSAGTYTVSVSDANNCQNSTDVVLEVYPLPVFSIEGSTTFCAGDQTTLSSSNTFDTYLWSTGEEESSIETDISGLYELAVSNEFGCIQTAGIEVEEIPLPIANAGEEAIINCYEPSVILGASAPQTNYTINWSGPDINADNEHEAYPEVSVGGQYTLIITDDIYGCISAPSTVEVFDQISIPSVILEVLDQLDCTTSSVLIDGSSSTSGDQMLYTWYDAALNELPNDNNAIIEVGEAAMYYLQVLDTLNGCHSIDSIRVEENQEYPIAEAGPIEELNCLITSLSLDGTASQQGNGINYNWSTSEGNIIDGANTVSPTVNAPGWYFLSVSDSFNGCTNIDSVYIDQDIVAPVVLTGSAQTIDCLHPTVFLSGEGSSSGSIYTYQWVLEQTADTISNDVTVVVSVPGNYLFTVTNEDNHCSSTANTLVEQNSEAPSAINIESTPPTCFEDEDGSIIIQGINGGTPPYLYSFNEQAFTTQTQFLQLPAGNYTLAVEDATGCTHSQMIELEAGNDLSVNAGPDIETQYGASVAINAIPSVGEDEIVQISWTSIDSLSCEGCFNPTLTATISGQYSISIIDDHGCVATDEVYIFVDNRKQVYLPNAFSPNGDGNNEIFYVQSGENVVKINSFLIFNRWGEPLFEVYNAPANDPFYGWDGNYKGTLLNSAVFTWFAEIEFTDGQVELFKGDVLLMR